MERLTRTAIRSLIEKGKVLIMTYDKDLGFADRYTLFDSPTVKVIKLVYKGSHAGLGEQTQVLMFDKDGYVVKQVARFNEDSWFTMVD